MSPLRLALDQVTVPCRELARSVAFYRQLGLALIVHSPPRYARLELPEGGATLSLELTEQPVGHGPELFLELPGAADLDAAVAGLQAQGLAFVHGPVDQPWLWREARLLDPDGNRLCLFFAGENRLHPPWRLEPG